MDAYNTDVRPLLRELREDMGLDPDPMGAYARSGYAEKIAPSGWAASGRLGSLTAALRGSGTGAEVAGSVGRSRTLMILCYARMLCWV